MKAVRLHKYHERPSLDDVPEPQVKGPLDVLVLTHPQLPLTLGHENAGCVEEVGSAFPISQ